MSRFRTRGLAFLGGAVLLALSLSAVFGAKPHADDQGLQVSPFVQGQDDEGENADELGDETEASEAEDATETEAEQAEVEDTDVEEADEANEADEVDEADEADEADDAEGESSD